MQSQNTATPCSFCDDADAPTQPDGHCFTCEKCAARLEGYADAERDMAMLEVRRTVRRAVETVGVEEAAEWVTAALEPKVVVTATMMTGTDDRP